MERQKTNILMVDDHKMTLIGYSSALNRDNEILSGYTFQITHATSISEALQKLDYTFNSLPLHLVFLDIQLPNEPQSKYYSGEDLGLAIRAQYPQTKILVITTFDNNLLIQNLLETINPEGLVIKSDVTSENFLLAVLEVLEDPPYYSKTVTKFLRKQQGFNHHLDRLDRLILYYISNGKLTKDLPNYVPLSLPGIERRKKRLKEIFDVEDGNDIDLLSRAREEGFL